MAEVTLEAHFQVKANAETGQQLAWTWHFDGYDLTPYSTVVIKRVGFNGNLFDIPIGFVNVCGDKSN